MTHETPAPEPTEIADTQFAATDLASTRTGASAVGRPRTRYGRRVLAVVAGVAMVPALYAGASAVTGGGERPSLSVAAHSADDATTSTLPGSDDDSATPTTPTLPGSDDDSATPTTPTLPGSDDDSATPTTPTVPGSDDDDDAPAPVSAAPVTQTFTSVGGSVEVTLTNGVLSLGPVTPATGYTAEIHDADSSRVEVRFLDTDGKEWRIRVEVASGAMTQEITFHG